VSTGTFFCISPLLSVYKIVHCVIFRVTTVLENLKMSGNFAVIREMSGIGFLSGNCEANVREKNLVGENCYNVCMLWVTDTDCDMILLRHSVIIVV